VTGPQRNVGDRVGLATVCYGTCEIQKAANEAVRETSNGQNETVLVWLYHPNLAIPAL
jgi:hypothetical protein